MRRLQLEPEVVRELIRDRQHVELCDQQGRTVGFFVPADLFVEMGPRPATNEEHERALLEISGEETERRLRNAGLLGKAEPPRASGEG